MLCDCDAKNCRALQRTTSAVAAYCYQRSVRLLFASPSYLVCSSLPQPARPGLGMPQQRAIPQVATTPVRRRAASHTSNNHVPGAEEYQAPPGSPPQRPCAMGTAACCRHLHTWHQPWPRPQCRQHTHARCTTGTPQAAQQHKSSSHAWAQPCPSFTPTKTDLPDWAARQQPS